MATSELRERLNNLTNSDFALNSEAKEGQDLNSPTYYSARESISIEEESIYSDESEWEEEKAELLKISQTLIPIIFKLFGASLSIHGMF